MFWVALGTGAGAEFPAIHEGHLTLHADATARRFVAAHGRRGLITGYAAGPLEGWVYPFRIFHDYRTDFLLGVRPRSFPAQRRFAK